VIREAFLGQNPNPRICFQCWQAGHFRRECPQRKLPPGPCPICQGKLEGTLSPLLRGTEVRASHPMMGPGSSHTGSCNHHKIGSPEFYSLLKSTRSASLWLLEPASQLFLSLPDPCPPKKLLFRAYQALNIISLGL
jgi:hypothetical protein